MRERETSARITFAYPTTVTDAGNFSSTIQYHYDLGLVTRTEGPPPAGQTQGAIQIITFDWAGRVERVTTDNNGAYQRFWYGPDYVASFTTVNNVADEAYTNQTFDGLGRPTGTANNHPGSQGGYKAVVSIYDAMGRRIKQSNPTEINGYWVPSGPEDTGPWKHTEQTYDWQGRPLRTTHPDTTTYREASYQGCGCAGGEVTTLTDEGTIDGGQFKRRQQKIYSDTFGRTWKTEVLNWQGGSVYSATVNTYNVRDQVTQIRQWAGAEGSGTNQDTIMTYDGYGRLKTRHVPEQNAGTATTWDYNADDTIQKITDARGASQTFGYNNRHLPTSITYAAPGGSGISVPAAASFGYDAAGNRTSMTDGMGSMSYSYNQLSSLTSETRTFNDPNNPAINGVSKTVTYEYNLAGQLKYLIDPAGSRVDYAYDATGRLAGVTGSGAHSAPAYATNLQYRAWGALKDIDFGNATHQWVNYNARLQPANMELRNTYVDAANPSVTLRWNYDYYADGRIDHAYDVSDNRFDRKLDYDHLARLKEAYSGREARGLTPTNPADSPFRQSFGYDGFGNMSSRTGRFWRQEQPPESATYTNDRRGGWGYDADGNVLADNTHANSFDAAGRQTRTLGPGNGCGREYEIVQVYDADHRPAKRVQTVRDEDYVGNPPEPSCTTNVTTTYFIYSSALGGAKLVELDASGSKVKGYVYGGGQRLAVQDVWTGGSSVSYHHANPGSPSWTETNSGRSAWRKEMGPLGEEVGVFDPYILQSLPTYVDLLGAQLFILGGDPFDFGGGCSWGGMPGSCSDTARGGGGGGASLDFWGSQIARLPGFGTTWGSFAALGLWEHEQRVTYTFARNGFVRRRPEGGSASAGPSFSYAPQEPTVENRYQGCRDEVFGQGATSYANKDIPGVHQTRLVVDAAQGNPFNAAMIAGLWAKESNFAEQPAGDAGPAQLTGWWRRNHPELIQGNAYGSWNGRTTQPFDGNVQDNINTLGNIVRFSVDRYRSYDAVAYWYGPGNPQNPRNAPASRAAYRDEVMNRVVNKYLDFFFCLPKR